MLGQGRAALVAQVFVQPLRVSVFFMLVEAVGQLNIGLVEAERLVVGCSHSVVLAVGVGVVFTQQHRDQMALPTLAVAVVEEPICL